MVERLNLSEWEEAASACVSPMAWDYYRSGARDEITLQANCDAWRRLRVAPRVLVDVSRRELGTTLLGAPLSMPILVAPTAFHKLAHPDGELATARAAGAAGTLMTLSTLSNTAVEDVTAAATGPVWFQLYIYRDRQATRALVERAEAAGCRAIVVTVDSPQLGTRERDVRNRFRLPDGLAVHNLLAANLGELPSDSGDSGLAAYFHTLIDPAITWADLGLLASWTRLPILVKGVLRADDAARAVDHGAAGVIVSNHGGRQLDGAVATADALPSIVDAVAGRAEVLVDGGIRRGTDVFKALALGASAVLLGRPILWGLAAGGEPGVRAVLELMRGELDEAMALAGCPDLGSIRRELLWEQR